jgi:hypothetical protein
MLKTSITKTLINGVFAQKELKALKKSPGGMERYLSILTALLQNNHIEKSGKKAFWLPSKADNPRPDHMHFYDKCLEDIPNGEVPGQAWGCQCAIGYK